jgi:putative tricarboxylic transport membrane protein
MSEGVQASGASAVEGSHRVSAVLVPVTIGLAALAEYWRTASGSHSGETLLICGLGLLALGGAVLVLRLVVHNPRDYYGGLALLAVALFAIWASSDLPGMRGFAFGPGTAPRLFAIVLGALGIVVMLIGLFMEGPGLERYDIRAPVLLVAAVFFLGFGQSTAMKVVAAVAAALGVLIAVIGMLRPNNQYIRGPLFIVLGILFFALTIRQFGLIFASYCSIVIAAFGTQEVRWFETLIWAAFLTLFCVLLFPIALNLPLQLWPTNLTFKTMFQFL